MEAGMRTLFFSWRPDPDPGQLHSDSPPPAFIYPDFISIMLTFFTETGMFLKGGSGSGFTWRQDPFFFSKGRIQIWIWVNFTQIHNPGWKCGFFVLF